MLVDYTRPPELPQNRTEKDIDAFLTLNIPNLRLRSIKFYASKRSYSLIPYSLDDLATMESFKWSDKISNSSIKIMLPKFGNDLCSKCGHAHLKDALCNPTPYCPNCYGNHPPNSNDCPKKLEYMKAIREQIKNNPIETSAKLINHQQRSYAEVTSSTSYESNTRVYFEKAVEAVQMKFVHTVNKTLKPIATTLKSIQDDVKSLNDISTQLYSKHQILENEITKINNRLSNLQTHLPSILQTILNGVVPPTSTLHTQLQSNIDKACALIFKPILTNKKRSSNSHSTTVRKKSSSIRTITSTNNNDSYTCDSENATLSINDK
ncbi:unnamed protein product [Didymodactylos carnosus]|uniref:Uncharacterized protein n=1 Tax=Didymodactylos carnosus TaxID=1234261 RepID=A0A814DK90_9BILA|nr:unnamed protein product [Didymodactylos carnosus]CAF3733122.1 unnamed protein product [Didymodactylos carnosus]